MLQCCRNPFNQPSTGKTQDGDGKGNSLNVFGLVCRRDKLKLARNGESSNQEDEGESKCQEQPGGYFRHDPILA